MFRYLISEQWSIAAGNLNSITINNKYKKLMQRLQ